MDRSRALAGVAERLISELSTQAELADKNLVLSPASVYAALGLLWYGAAGRTKDELGAFLGAGSDEELRAALREAAREGRADTGPLSGACGLFVARTFELLPGISESFGTELAARVEQLAFDDPAAVQAINRWVERATKGRIPRIVTSLDATGVMVLLSALHFRAAWASPFAQAATFDQPFLLRSGESVQRPSMHKTTSMPIWLGTEWHLVELAYEEADYAMVIALATDPTQRLLDFHALAAGVGALQPRTVRLRLPRFRGESELSLSAALSRADVRAVFDPSRADFSGLSAEQLYASAVVHKACVAVTEQGTEAAAVTAVPLARSLPPPDLVPFVVNRPFWFVIRDRRSGALLFVGRVEDPAG